MRELKLSVPTYYGAAQCKGNVVGNDEFDEPQMPVLVHEAEGVRIVLGTHDFEKGDKPDIQIERRPKGWAIFLHPSAGDACGYVFFLDDGRSYLLPERAWSRDWSIQILDDDEPPELDEIDKPLPDAIPPTSLELAGKEALDTGAGPQIDTGESAEETCKGPCARCGQDEDASEDWYGDLCPTCADETDCGWVCMVCGRSGSFEEMGGDGPEDPICCATPCQRLDPDDEQD